MVVAVEHMSCEKRKRRNTPKTTIMVETRKKNKQERVVTSARIENIYLHVF